MEFLDYVSKLEFGLKYLFNFLRNVGIHGPKSIGLGPEEFSNLGPDQNQKNLANLGITWTKIEKILEIQDRAKKNLKSSDRTGTNSDRAVCGSLTHSLTKNQF